MARGELGEILDHAWEEDVKGVRLGNKEGEVEDAIECHETRKKTKSDQIFIITQTHQVEGGLRGNIWLAISE